MLKRVTISIVVFLSLIGLASIEIPTASTSGDALNAVTQVPAPRATDGTFRVDNFNVQRGKGNDGERDLTRAIGVLQGADIAGLQELSGTLFYGWQDQATQVGEALGLEYLFAPTTYRWLQTNRGSGLFNRFPVERWEIQTLPRVEGSKADRRNLVRAEVLIDGRPVTLFVTHLDRRESNNMQLQVVLQALREVEGPAILMADLNIDLSDETLMGFLAESDYIDAIHAGIGDFWRLDWILAKDFDVVEGGYTPRGISDHAHYWVRLRFSEELGTVNEE